MSEGPQRRPSERVAEIVDGYVATTIPVHVDIDVEPSVLSEPEAEEILRGAETIALGLCACRKGAGNCAAPLDTCLVIDEDVEEMKSAGYEGFRVVSLDDAIAALRASHEGGLVHMAYRKGDGRVTQFCSCCSCCCWFLNELKDYDYHEAIIESNYVAQHDTERCVGCGLCIDRCHFDAWKSNGAGKPHLAVEKCFGCGVCVTTCPSNAISLVERPTS